MSLAASKITVSDQLDKTLAEHYSSTVHDTLSPAAPKNPLHDLKLSWLMAKFHYADFPDGEVSGKSVYGIWDKGDVTALSRTCRGRHWKVGIVEFELMRAALEKKLRRPVYRIHFYAPAPGAYLGAHLAPDFGGEKQFCTNFGVKKLCYALKLLKIMKIYT